MNLCKKISVALLCSSLSSPFCMAMDPDPDIKQERKINPIAEENYKSALSNLNSYLTDSNDLYFENIINYTTLAAKEFYSPAENLLSILNSLENLEDAKTALKKATSLASMRVSLNTLYKYAPFYTQIYYVLKRFDDGINHLLPLLETDYENAPNLLLSIFGISLDAVSHFEKKLTIVFEQNNKSEKTKQKIQAIFLNALCKTKDIAIQLDLLTLGRISTRYWVAFCDSGNKKEYLEQAIRYSLLAAIKDRAPSRLQRLIMYIGEGNAYDVYYSILIPLLEVGDKQAQDLFNKVACDFPETYKRFGAYAQQNSSILGVYQRVSEAYLQYMGERDSRFFLPSMAYLGEKKNFTPSLPATAHTFNRFPNLTDREKGMSHKELYNLAMKNIDRNNDKALDALLRSAEDGNNDALKKLKKYRESGRYKKGDKEEKTGSIEYSLYQRDKLTGNLATSKKKEATLSSSSPQTLQNIPTSSRRRPAHKRNAPKGESEKITATTPALVPSKKKSESKKNDLLESLEGAVNKHILEIENTPFDLTNLESVDTSILETPPTNLGINPIVDIIQEVKGNDKEPVPVLTIVDDRLPTESREESTGFEGIIESPKPISERKTRKTLPRRNSLKLEKAPKNEETSKPKIRRTQSLMNLQLEPQGIDASRSEESKKKKKKEPSAKMSLKQFLPTHKAEKKLERQKSKSNVCESTPETPQENNQTGQAGSKTTNPFKKLTRSLSHRDLRRKSDVSLDESVITNTLNEFKEQGIIDWTRKGNTISATKNDDQNVRLTIHAHDGSDKSWAAKPEIRTDFLEFSSECDEDLKETISQIGKKKPSKK